MGERYHFRELEFNGSIQIESRDEQLSPLGGQVLLREVGERLGLWEWLERRLEDPRDEVQREYELVELVRSRTLLMSSGCGDQRDIEEKKESGLFSVVSSSRRGVKAAQQPRVCSQPTLSRLGGILSREHNRAVLDEALVVAAGRLRRSLNRGHRKRGVTLDVDIFPIDAHGEQEGSAYSGHYERRVFLAACVNIAETGDLVGLKLLYGLGDLTGQVLPWLLTLCERLERELAQKPSLRFDAAFPCEEWLSAWEDGESKREYVTRIKSNARLKTLAAPHLESMEGTLAVGEIRVEELEYAAESWSKKRRVVLVMIGEEDDSQPRTRHFFLLTSYAPNRLRGLGLLEHYRRRGKAEGHIGELADVINVKLSSTNRTKSHYQGREVWVHETPLEPFHVNSVNLYFAGISYILLHALRLLLNASTDRKHSIRKVLQSVVRIPARILSHSRQLRLVIVSKTARLWARITAKINVLRNHKKLTSASF